MGISRGHDPRAGRSSNSDSSLRLSLINLEILWALLIIYYSLLQPEGLGQTYNTWDAMLANLPDIEVDDFALAIQAKINKY